MCERMPGLARAADLARSAARPNGGALSSPPVYAARSPAPLTRGRGCVPLRTGDNICPHAPRLRGRLPIRQEERAGGEAEEEREEGGESGAAERAGRQ